MIDPAKAPYHISPHQAEVLLGPVDATLAEIEARLAHYAERVPMTDVDRAYIRRAHEIITRARAGVNEIGLEARSTRSAAK